MPSKFSYNDKITLIGMCKFIINADGITTDAELDSMLAVADEIGFDDYNEIFNDVDERITTIDDLKEYIDNTKESSNKESIFRYAVLISRSDGNIRDEEIDILHYAADAWDISISEIMNK
jgi:tellurite resistance protein